MRKFRNGTIAGLLIGSALIGGLAIPAVYAQVVVGSQDFSITVENPSDTLPNTFTFASVTNAEPNTQVISNQVTITGIDTVVPVTISGSGTPQFSLDGGTTWVTSGEIESGGTLQVRLTSGPLFYSGSPFNTTRTATVQVGTGSASFFVQNRVGDTTPDAFVFASTTGSPINTVVASGVATITGIESASAVTVSGAGNPQISIAGGTWVTSGVIENNQEIRVRMTSPRTYETLRSATVTIGGVQGTWSLTTADCVTGDLFSLAVGQGTCYNNLEVVNAGPGLITVGTVGTEYPNWAEATALCGALGSEWGLPPDSVMTGTGSINVNRDVAGVKAVLDQSNSSTYWTSTSSRTVTLGLIPQILTGVNSSASAFCFTQPWLTSQFVPEDYVPDAFSIASASGEPGTLVTSAPVTISGLASGRTVQMSVAGDAAITPTFSINGDAFSNVSRPVKTGDSVVFRVAASQFNGADVVLTAETRDPAGTITGSATFTVTTVAPASQLVDTFAFNWQYFPQTYFGTLPGDIYQSEIITLSGGSGTRPLRVLGSSGYYNSGSLNRWPRVYGSRIFYKNTNVTITTSLTDDANAVMWSTANTNYPNIVTDVGRTLRLKFAPANQSNEGYSVLCVGATCAEYIWTNSATRSDPRAANPFDIVDVTGAENNTLYTSAPFTVSWAPRTAGVQPPNIPISVSGTGAPEYRINGGAWTTAAGWVRSGSTVEVRQTSAATNGTDRVATLSVGTTTSTYVVRTQDILIPDAFALVAATGSTPNTLVTSAPVTITGISAAVPVSVSGEGNPLLSVNGGDWVSEATVGPNAQVRVRLTSASAYEATRTATLDVNGVTGNFAVTTAPFSFAVAPVTDVLINATATSEPVTMPAFLPASAISIVGDGSPSYSLNGGAFTDQAGTITAGDVLRVRLTAAGTKDTARLATVTIGSATAGFSVRTAPPEACETGAVGSVCSDGAVYAGLVNGYKIFAAPSSDIGVMLKSTASVTMGSISNDGLINHHATTLAGISNHPAAAACAARGPEWVVPSATELQTMYTNRASAPAGTYVLSGSTASRYWSSTEFTTDPRRGTYRIFDGGTTGDASKNTAYQVHCVRYSREEPRVYQDPCASGAPAIGTMCADGAVYAGALDGKDVYFESMVSANNVAYKTAATFTTGTNTIGDPVQARLAMEFAGLSQFPGQQVCAAKGVSAYGSEWYLPTRRDLQHLITNRNSGVLRQMTDSNTRGATEVPQYIMAATQEADARYAEYLDKGTSGVPAFGTSTIYRAKNSANKGVLCMRFDSPQTYADPCAGTPAVGAFCADGTVYAGNGYYLPNVGTLSSELQLRTTATSLAGTTSASDGMANTNAMIAAGNHPAAQACRALGSDWFLPAIDQLTYLSSVRTIGEINGMYGRNTSSTTPGGEYWSSTQSVTPTASQTRILASTTINSRLKSGVEGVICLRQ